MSLGEPAALFQGLRAKKAELYAKSRVCRLGMVFKAPVLKPLELIGPPTAVAVLFMRHLGNRCPQQDGSVVSQPIGKERPGEAVPGRGKIAPRLRGGEWGDGRECARGGELTAKRSDRHPARDHL